MTNESTVDNASKPDAAATTGATNAADTSSAASASDQSSEAAKTTEATKAEGDKPAANDNATKEAAKDTANEGDKAAKAEEFNVSLPDGVVRNDEVMGELAKIAQEYKLPKEAMQRLADLGVKATGNPGEAIKAARAEWRKTIVADKELGGDKLNENLSVAKKGLEAVGSPELTQMLEETGLGDHPAVIRAFHKVGALFKEDKFVPAGSGAGPRDPASILFPNQGKKSA